MNAFKKPGKIILDWIFEKSFFEIYLDLYIQFNYVNITFQ